MSLERIHRFADFDELTRGIAASLAMRLVELQRTKDRVHVALAGGRQALAVYQGFANIALAGNIDLTRIEYWWSSEAWVSTTDPNRNSTQALSMLAPILPLASQVHPIPTNTGTSDPDEAAFDYAEELGDTVLDVCLLHIGATGKIASIYPDHASMDPGTNSSQRVLGIDSPPGEEISRVSLSLSTINASSQVWIMASGTDRAAAVKSALHHDPALPASLVHGVEATHWFVDEDAARDLPLYSCQY